MLLAERLAVVARLERALLGAAQAFGLAVLLAELLRRDALGPPILLAELLRGEAFGTPILLLKTLGGDPLARLGALRGDAAAILDRPHAALDALLRPGANQSAITVGPGSPFDALLADFDAPRRFARSPLESLLRRPRPLDGPLDALRADPRGALDALLTDPRSPLDALLAGLPLDPRSPLGARLARLGLGLGSTLSTLLAFASSFALGLNGSGDSKRRDTGDQ